MSLRLRLVLLFSTIIVIVASLQMGLNLWSGELASQRFNQNLLENYQGHWQKVIELQKDDMLDEQKSLTRDRTIVKSLRKEDHARVGESAFATFNRLSTSGVIDYLDIYAKTGDVAYSSSQAQTPIGGMAKEAFDEQEVRSGLMTMGEGHLVIGVSFPLYYRGKLVGAARYGKRIDTALAEFTTMTQTQALFVQPAGEVVADPQSLAQNIDIQLPDSQAAQVYSAEIENQHHFVSVLPIQTETGHLLGFVVSAKNDHDNYQQTRTLKLTEFAVTAIALVLSIVVLRWVLGISLKPLGTAIKTLRDIGAGDLDTQAWRGEWRGEFAALMSELGEMQMQLDQRTQIEQRYAQENNRTLKALDSVANAVMISGADDKIVYLNTAATQLMLNIEAEVRSIQPDFIASQLLGRHIDVFKQHRQGSESMIDDSGAAHVYELQLGNMVVEMTVNAITENTDQRLGTVVEWRDLTPERRVVDEVSRVVAGAQCGNLDQSVSLDGKEGVFLALSESVNDMITITRDVIQDTARVLGALANGDLNETIANDYQGAYGALKQDANRTVENLKEVVARIQASTSEVRQAAAEIDNGNQSLGMRTEQTADSLQSTSASIEEITSAVQRSAENLVRASELVNETNSRAENGGAVVDRAIDAMQQINTSSTKISDITTVINEIAFQTNLLALNAAVESARAGEHGKGFAVVASEVRNLASRCAVAAKEIRDLIETSIAKVENGQKLVDQTGANLHDIVDSIREVAALVNDISISGKEQALGLEQINEAVTRIDTATQENAALVREVSSASSLASQQSRELNGTIDFFTLDLASSSPSGQGAERDAA